MSKKKEKELIVLDSFRLPEWMWKEQYVQEKKVLDLLQEFAPNGKHAEFIEAVEVGKILMDSGIPMRLSQDLKAKEYCMNLILGAKSEGEGCLDIDLYYPELTYEELHFEECEIRIMFKVDSSGPTYFVKQNVSDYNHDSIILRFLVDMVYSGGEAFLVFDDIGVKEEPRSDLEGKISSFVKLWELHGIIRGYNFDDDVETISDYIVSFKRETNRCVVEPVLSYGDSPIEVALQHCVDKLLNTDSVNIDEADSTAPEKKITKAKVTAKKSVDDSDIQTDKALSVEESTNDNKDVDKKQHNRVVPTVMEKPIELSDILALGVIDDSSKEPVMKIVNAR